MRETTDLNSVLKELHEVSGFRISVHDTAFREIASYPESLTGYCGLVQQNPRARALCLEADRKAFEQAQRSDGVYIYRCPFGLYEAVSPLCQFGVPAGFLMMGQALDGTEHSRIQAAQSALPYTADGDALAQAVREIPSTTREKLRSCFRIMQICAEYITLTNRLSPADSRLIPAVRSYLEENFRRKLLIEELCSHFFCSRSTLLNAFKQECGVTISRYLNELRLEEACRLLTGSTRPIGEIAEACGFADQNYFSKVFRRACGMTPSEYRERGVFSFHRRTFSTLTKK